MSSNNWAVRGFALPTVLVAGVVMMIVLMAGLQATVSIRTALQSQYYEKLAQEASESGIVRAQACLRESSFTITWTVAKPLKPNTDCNGDVIGGANANVIDSDLIRTTFTVNPPASEDDLSVKSVGTTSLMRSVGSTVSRSYGYTFNGVITTERLDASEVASGLYQVCVILGGQTWCNGGNQSGQVGNGLVEPLWVKLYVRPVRVLRQSGNLLGKVDKITASGNEAACTVTTDNNIYCWGSNAYRYLGNGSSTDPYPTPSAVQKPASMNGKEITKLAMGYNTSCAVAGGDLYCWGRNQYGQIGDGTTTQRSTPVMTSTIGTSNGIPVTDVTMSPYADFTCAVAGGDTYCWGRNTYGQIGDGTTTTRLTPRLVSKQAGALAGKTVVKVVNEYAPRLLDGGVTSDSGGSARYYYRQAHACALTSDGQVFCWGSNRYGQMGQGTWGTSNQTVPIRVLGNLSGKTVRDIATSYRTPCALTTEADTGNRFYCWGGNQFGAGAVGHNQPCDNSGSYTYMCSPTPVDMEPDGLQDRYIDSISAGVNRVCAIADSASYCAGNNGAAQLGDGTTTNRYSPTEAKVLRLYQPAILY